LFLACLSFFYWGIVIPGFPDEEEKNMIKEARKRKADVQNQFASYKHIGKLLNG